MNIMLEKEVNMRIIGFIFLVFCGVLNAADKQSVSGNIIGVEQLYPGDVTTIQIYYEATDQTLNGLGFRLHYDSSQLEFVSLDEVFEQSLIGQQLPKTDSEDYDEHPKTDQYINTAWADLGGNWPGDENVSQLLYSVTFKVLGGFKGTQIFFSDAANSPLDVEFQGIPVMLNAL